MTRADIAVLNLSVLSKALVDNGGLCVLTIDATAFHTLELEYGSDIHQRVKVAFQAMLQEMWGKPGCFRSDDSLTARTKHGHVYDVVLNRSREAGALPMPGVLEKIADRLNRKILAALWDDVSTNSENRRLPSCLTRVPTVSVGFASVLHNPCLNSTELVEKLLDRSEKSAGVQKDRLDNLQRELLLALIDNQEMLCPNFQAVFHLPHLTKELVDQVQQKNSIQHLQNHIFGFESLIRVQHSAVHRLINQEGVMVEVRHLRPDVLFGMAKDAHVTLELDQACLRQAAKWGKDLPGQLLVNILPRNLYFFDRLLDIFEGRPDLMFEVSESEAINNFELMGQVRKSLQQKNILVAADDFGRGFAGLERIIKIKPDLIKLDRSLVENIDQDLIRKTYVRGLIEAGKLLKATVLAEGVERWEELQTLQSMGVDLIQGYLLHRPQSAKDIEQALGSEHIAINDVNSVA